MGDSFKMYVSSDESNEEPNNKTTSITKPKRRKKRIRNWYKSDTYNSKEEALNAVKEKTIWSYHYETVTSDGKKVYYRCNAVKRRGEQCTAGLYLLYCINKSDVIVFQTQEGHSHQWSQRSTRKLNDDIKNKIKSLFDLKVKPKKMMEILVEQGIKLKKTQLLNYLTKLRRPTYETGEIDLDEPQQWNIKIDDDKLIREVQVRPALWDEHIGKHSSAIEKKILWNEIAHVFIDDSTQECDKNNMDNILISKWNCLLKQYKMWTSNSEDPERILPPIYRKMQFLKSSYWDMLKTDFKNNKINKNNLECIKKGLLKNIQFKNDLIDRDVDLQYLLSIYPIFKSIPDNFKSNIKHFLTESLDMFLNTTVINEAVSEDQGVQNNSSTLNELEGNLFENESENYTDTELAVKNENLSDSDYA